MELVSELSKSRNGLPEGSTVPDKYIFPPEKRAGMALLDSSSTISFPVIDLRGGGAADGVANDDEHLQYLVEQIMQAGKQFGFFQVVNHGVSEEVMKNMMNVVEEFFEMPLQDKSIYYSNDNSKPFRLATSTTYDQNQTRYWRDYLKLVCYPVDQAFHHWPENPPKFREYLAKYTVEVQVLAKLLLKLIARGLGFGDDFLCGDLSQGQTQMNVNYYPPCPDPSLTMGLVPHCDRHLITLLQQGTAASGLQAKYGGNWINVQPIAEAFVINFGHQLEILTNGILKSVEHRAVTNSVATRTSIATLIMPKMDCLIAPAKELVSEDNPPKYKPFVFKDFISAYDAAAANREGVLEFFKIN